MKIRTHLSALLLLPILALVVGCGGPAQTIDKLRQQIDGYPSNPTQAAAAEIDGLFAELDRQIAAIEQRGQTEKAALFKEQRNELQAKFAAAKVGATIGKFGSALKGVGEAIGSAGKEIGDAIRKAAEQQDSPAPDSE